MCLVTVTDRVRAVLTLTTKPITTMRVTKSTKSIFSFSNSDMLCSCRSATRHAVTHAAMHAAIHAAMYAAMPA